MHGDTVVTKDQEGGKRPLNKNKSNESPLKMNKGVELLLRNKRRRLPLTRTFQVKFGHMMGLFNREIHIYFEFHLDLKKKVSQQGGK